MANFSKVVERLKKKIPEITDDEISEIISTIPANMPTRLVYVLIDVAHVCYNDRDKLKKLQSTDAKEVLGRMEK